MGRKKEQKRGRRGNRVDQVKMRRFCFWKGVYVEKMVVVVAVVFSFSLLGKEKPTALSHFLSLSFLRPFAFVSSFFFLSFPLRPLDTRLYWFFFFPFLLIVFAVQFCVLLIPRKIKNKENQTMKWNGKEKRRNFIWEKVGRSNPFLLFHIGTKH